MLRTSSYTIYVALPGNDAEMLLVHGYTGAYNKVSRRVAQYLLSQEAGPPPKPLYGEWSAEPGIERSTSVEPPSDRTLEQLQKRGYLTSFSVEEEEGYFARTAKKLHRLRQQGGVNYLFMPTYQCNLRCSYCFQNHIRTDPAYQHLLRVISRETVDQIFEAFPTIELGHGIEPGEQITRRIGFYGGEPLLASNRSTVEYIMEGARRMGPASFWAVSNATELEAYEGLLGPDGIAMVQITLDGPADEHDQRRIHADGSGSYAQITRNIDRCLEWGVQVSIRMNLDRTNIGNVPRLADDIVRRGWHEHPNFSVYTARIVATNDKTSIAASFLTTWDLDQALDELRAEYPNMRMVGRPDEGMNNRARRLFESRGNGLGQLKTSFCSAHTNMYIFDAFGDMYACWDRTGDERVRIGRVRPGGQVEVNEATTRMWRSRTPATNPTCRKCRYAFQCGGGCAVLAEGQKGKFFSNYCDGFADRFRHSVAEAYMQYLAGAESVKQVRVCDL